MADKAVWDEYGLEEAEQAEYTSGAAAFYRRGLPSQRPHRRPGRFPVAAPRRRDAVHVAPLAVETQDSVLFAFHNYLFRLEGRKPEAAELAPLLQPAPRGSISLRCQCCPATCPPRIGPQLGALRAWARPRSRDSSRASRPRVAAFHLGTEAQLAKYQTQGGETGLAIFSYPTPNFARERAVEFSKLPGAMVKRSGPLLAVILAPPNPDEAERLLSKVSYQATITWSEYVPTGARQHRRPASSTSSR